MSPTSELTRRAARRRISWSAFAAAAIIAAVPASALGANVTKTGLAQGIAGFPNAGPGLGVFEPGSLITDTPDAVREVGKYSIDVVATSPAEDPFAGTFSAYAVTDIRNHTDDSVLYENMDVQLAATAWAFEFGPEVAQKLTWLLRNADALIAAEANADQAAAAIQAVVWQTLRNPPGLDARADLEDPTDSVVINDLADKFTAMMEAAFAGGAPAALALGAGPVANCGSTVTITGTPGTVVTVTVDSGGTLDKHLVVLGPDGTATVQVAITGVNVTATVTAQAATGGELVRLDPDGPHEADEHTKKTGSNAPEELIYLRGGVVESTATAITCTAPPPVDPPGGTLVTPPPSTGTSSATTAPTSPTVQGTQVPVRRAVLRVTKTGPRGARAGQLVTFRLKVQNRGRLLARGVRLRDVLPRGYTLARRVRGATFRRGVLTWRVGNLRPGRSRTVIVRLRVGRALSGRRCNTGIATASNARTARAVACTRIRAVAGATQPAVTG